MLGDKHRRACPVRAGPRHRRELRIGENRASAKKRPPPGFRALQKPVVPLSPARTAPPGRAGHDAHLAGGRGSRRKWVRCRAAAEGGQESPIWVVGRDYIFGIILFINTCKDLRCHRGILRFRSKARRQQRLSTIQIQVATSMDRAPKPTRAPRSISDGVPGRQEHSLQIAGLPPVHESGQQARLHRPEEGSRRLVAMNAETAKKTC